MDKIWLGMEWGEPIFHLTKQCTPLAFLDIGNQNLLKLGKLDSIQPEQTEFKLWLGVQ